MYFNTPYPNQTQTQPSQYAKPYDLLDIQTHPDPALILPYIASLPQPSDSYAVTEPNHSAPSATDSVDALTHFLTPSKPDPLMDILGQQAAFHAKSVEELLGLIYEREHLKYDNIKHIDYESSQLKGRLFEIGTIATGIDKGIDRTRGQIERDLFAFERDKRMEEINCWRDVVRLKGDLRETLHTFQQEKRKENLLSGHED